MTAKNNVKKCDPSLASLRQLLRGNTKQWAMLGAGVGVQPVLIFWFRKYRWMENIPATTTSVVQGPSSLSFQMCWVIKSPGEWSTPSNSIGFESTFVWCIFQSMDRTVDDKVGRSSLQNENIPSEVWTGYSLADYMASTSFLDTQMVLIWADVQSSDYFIEMGIFFLDNLQVIFQLYCSTLVIPHHLLYSSLLFFWM